MRKARDELEDDLRPEYFFDYSKAVRGKYAKRIASEGTNIVVLDRDIARVFRDSASVNKALRELIAIAKRIRVKSISPIRRSNTAAPQLAKRVRATHAR